MCLSYKTIPEQLSPLHRRMQIVTRDSTLTEIANRTAHHPETVRRYMRGQDPSIRFVQRLCQEYGVDANWMLLGTDSVHQRVIDLEARSLGTGCSYTIPRMPASAMG